MKCAVMSCSGHLSVDLLGVWQWISDDLVIYIEFNTPTERISSSISSNGCHLFRFSFFLLIV